MIRIHQYYKSRRSKNWVSASNLNLMRTSKISKMFWVTIQFKSVAKLQVLDCIITLKLDDEVRQEYIGFLLKFRLYFIWRMSILVCNRTLTSWWWIPTFICHLKQSCRFLCLRKIIIDCLPAHGGRSWVVHDVHRTPFRNCISDGNTDEFSDGHQMELPMCYMTGVVHIKIGGRLLYLTEVTYIYNVNAKFGAYLSVIVRSMKLKA